MNQPYRGIGDQYPTGRGMPLYDRRSGPPNTRRKGSGARLAVLLALLFSSSTLGYSLMTSNPAWNPEPGSGVPEPVHREIVDFDVSSIRKDGPPLPYKYELEWKIGTVYETWGGCVEISLSNIGETHLIVEKMGFRGEWGGEYVRNTSVYIPPGEKRPVGLLSFSPPTSGVGRYHHYQVGVRVLVGQSPSTSENTSVWYEEEGIRYRGSLSFILTPLARPTPFILTTEKTTLWEKARALVSPDDPGVENITASIREKWGPGYTADHLAAAFGHVKEHIRYVPDLPGEDNWLSPGETLALGEGDCEDHALLLASIVESLGGRTVLAVMSDHAFSLVYIGKDVEEASAIWNAIEEYYGTPLQPCWMEFNGGIWLVADTLGGLYLGSLPVGAYPTSPDPSVWGWTFTSTVCVSLIPL
ncbi:MAG: hypothetical protein J7L61_04375 [Thermoplasmata archaeon]|nr:hypothetical protein [Thermoplasmata archaeon]